MGIAYAVATWVLIQIADILLDNFGAPPWVMKSLVVVLAIGFFVALFFAWAFEMTPEGVKRESEVDRSGSPSRRAHRQKIEQLHPGPDGAGSSPICCSTNSQW